MTETEAIDVLDIRAPGRGRAVVNYALHVGLARRIAGEDDQADALAAVGRPSRTLAARRQGRAAVLPTQGSQLARPTLTSRASTLPCKHASAGSCSPTPATAAR
jgi:hypothetical protein